GSVSVTDGVQTLRFAAGLSSSCTLEKCDVDGNGAVTVTDGVNVLRKAAGLTIAENCQSRDAKVAPLLRNTVPIFGGLTKTSGGAQAADAANLCENEGQGGTSTFDPNLGELDFTNCLIDGLLYDGTIGIDGNTGTLSFGIDFTLADDPNETFSFDGDL